MSASKRGYRNRTRNVFKGGFSKIERIYAHLGMIHIQCKDGKLVTMTPHDAATRCRALNADLPDEPSSRRVAVALIEQTIQACRVALNQHEDPKDSTTKAVTEAVDKLEAVDLSKVSPAQFMAINKYAVQFPMLDKEEIRVILTRSNDSDNFKEGLMKALNEERMIVFQKTGRLTAPF